MRTCELWDMIPPEERELKMSYGCVELSPDFMGFEEPYKAVAWYLPHDYTVIDLGCNQAAQCYYFNGFKKYIGVDCYDERYTLTRVPPLRFVAINTYHIVSAIENYLESVTSDKFWNDDATANGYFILSAVPHFPPNYLEKYGIKNYLWYYPMMEPVAKGIQADNILKRLNELLTDRTRYEKI